MSFEAVELIQEITYWLPGANNGTGGITYDVGVSVPGRMARKVDQVTTDKGHVVNTEFAVYLGTQLPTGTYVALGDFAGLGIDKAAREVVNVSTNISMTGLTRVLL